MTAKRLFMMVLLLLWSNSALAAPTVTERSPAPGATGVAENASVSATFSEALDPASLTTGSVVLEQQVGVVAIAAGWWHTVALQGDGTVAAWGSNDRGQAEVPVGLDGVVAIAAGWKHTVALKGDGTVVAWGANEHCYPNETGDAEICLPAGQATVPAGLSGVVAIAAGLKHTVALKSDGSVVAWGSNESCNWDYETSKEVCGISGQATVPVGLDGVVAIAAGGSHTLALKTDGSVIAWGDNFYGQIDVPEGLDGVVAIAAGGIYSLALKGDGSVVAWGYPLALSTGLEGVVAIAAGVTHALALKSDGGVVAWGWNSQGQATVPAGLHGVVAVAAGYDHSVVLQTDGTLTGWGHNYWELSRAPTELSGAKTLTAGMWRSAALQGDGSVVAWGANGNYAATEVPVGLDNVTALAMGPTHTLALRADGTVVAWGYNGNGETNVPIELSGVIAIAAGSRHSAALRNNGSVVGWGNYLTTGLPAILNGVTAIAAGGGHTVALQGDGSVVAWGRNDYGQTNVPEGLSGVVAIAAGEAHTVALQGDGSVVAWGANEVCRYQGYPSTKICEYTGQATVPAELGGVVAVAAGAAHTVALKGDGTLVGWGNNDSGQAAAPPALGYTAVPASVAYEAGSNTATLTPAAPLAAASLYRARVFARASDGTPLAGNQQWQFSTGGSLTSFLVLPRTGLHGRLSPAIGRLVLSGETAAFTVTPAAGYQIDQVSGCGGTLTGSTYTTGPASADCTVTATFRPLPVASVTLTPNDASPSSPGTSITFTAAASGGSGSYEYKFLYQTPAGNWVTARNYATTPTWNWATAGLPAGAYVVVVQARNVGSAAGSEAAKGVNYVLMTPAGAVTLTPSDASPSSPGTSITFTAAASGGSGSYEYKFLYQTPAGSWVTARNYATTPTWNWATAGLPAGAYVVVVQARNVGSTTGVEAAKGVSYVLE